MARHRDRRPQGQHAHLPQPFPRLHRRLHAALPYDEPRGDGHDADGRGLQVMNLNTIVEVKRPTSPDEIGPWHDGCAWLAGGTWLFSEPQVATHTLIDLNRLGWLPLTPSAAGLEIAATCRIADLHAFAGPAEWRAVALFRDCIDAFLMSFKIWNAATVGGNICMSLPAGAMISLTAALEGVCTLWPRNGEPREVSVVDFVTGNHRNILQKGELLRNIHLPAAALSKRTAMRQVSLTRH